MVQLVDRDVKTREVLGWKGVHVFHNFLSVCSQKLRIFLNLKGILWQSHPVDLTENENMSAWFLGINPRGLVPVLVHDGVVHIESNDIITYLEDTFPQPRLIPPQYENEMAALLKRENDLHLDVRSLSFRFVFAPTNSRKSPEDLKQYNAAGSGTVGGRKDAEIEKQIDFWSRFAEHGITDHDACASASRFREAFDDLERRLIKQRYLLGDTLTALDIAWFTYVDRLTLAAYPFARLHPHVADWFANLSQRPEFTKETQLPAAVSERFARTRFEQVRAGKSLEMVAGF
jgi:glutathione S-transferase